MRVQDLEHEEQKRVLGAVAQAQLALLFGASVLGILSSIAHRNLLAGVASARVKLLTVFLIVPRKVTIDLAARPAHLPGMSGDGGQGGDDDGRPGSAEGLAEQRRAELEDVAKGDDAEKAREDDKVEKEREENERRRATDAANLVAGSSGHIPQHDAAARGGIWKATAATLGTLSAFGARVTRSSSQIDDPSALAFLSASPSGELPVAAPSMTSDAEDALTGAQRAQQRSVISTLFGGNSSRAVLPRGQSAAAVFLSGGNSSRAVLPRGQSGAALLLRGGNSSAVLPRGQSGAGAALWAMGASLVHRLNVPGAGHAQATGPGGTEVFQESDSNAGQLPSTPKAVLPRGYSAGVTMSSRMLSVFTGRGPSMRNLYPRVQSTHDVSNQETIREDAAETFGGHRHVHGGSANVDNSTGRFGGGGGSSSAVTMRRTEEFVENGVPVMSQSSWSANLPTKVASKFTDGGSAVWKAVRGGAPATSCAGVHCCLAFEARHGHFKVPSP